MTSTPQPVELDYGIIYFLVVIQIQFYFFFLDLIFDLSQTALDLNYDGLMIESHCDPDNAWSDAKQQVTPKVLSNIIKKLETKNAFHKPS